MAASHPSAEVRLRLLNDGSCEADLAHAALAYGSARHSIKLSAGQDILLILDGAPNHRCRDLVLPGSISLLFLPPYSPELNPKENLWEEIREKIFKNYALKSIDAVRAKLEEAILYIERDPETVKSITSFQSY